MIRRPPRSTRTDTLFPTRRSSDLILLERRIAVRAARVLQHVDQPALIGVALAALAVVVEAADREGRDLLVEGAAVQLQHLLRSEEHTSELQSLMRISYAVFCLKKTTNHKNQQYAT